MTDHLPAPLTPLQAVLEAYQAPLSPQTRRAYNSGLASLCRLANLTTPRDLAERLATLPMPEAKLLCFRLREGLIASGCSAATTNLRLAALRKLLAVMLDLGAIDWSTKLGKVRASPVEDRSGPSEADYSRMLQAARNPLERATLRLLGDAGLRVGEVLSLRAEDVVRNAAGRISGVLAVRKGSDGHRSFCPVGSKTAAAIEAAGASLFEKRSQTGVRAMVRRVAKRAGVTQRVRPHGLRHAALGRGARISKDPFATAALAGHKDTKTVFQSYFDDKAQKAAELAEAVESPETTE